MSKTKKEYRIENRPKTIYRVVKSAENPYVMIDKRPVDNPALSFKAKGILTYLMSRPDGWEVSVADLINHSTDGEDSVRSGLKELRDAGHMKYTKMRNKGRITGWLIEVYEVPTSPHADFPDVDLPDVENPTQVLKNLSSNKKIRNKDRLMIVSQAEEEEEEFTNSSSSNLLKTQKMLNDDVETVSQYWHEIAEIKPSRTLKAVFKRVLTFCEENNFSNGQAKSDLISLIDKTFLNSPKLPENYMITCVGTLQENYKRNGFLVRT